MFGSRKRENLAEGIKIVNGRERLTMMCGTSGGVAGGVSGGLAATMNLSPGMAIALALVAGIVVGVVVSVVFRLLAPDHSKVK